MFGYININRKELSEESQRIYRAYYCGLCRKLKTECGKRGQILLNYDMTFLIVLLSGLYETECEEKTFVCAAHPMKKRLLRSSEVTEYAAHMNVILAYHNLIDDWKDDHAYTKRTLAGMIHKDYTRIAERYPRQIGAVLDYLERLAAYEEKDEQNIDLVAGLTGEMLGEMFAWKQDEWYNELKTLGFYLGKFIYMMDAYEDLDEDERRNHYNPLRNLRQENGADFETLCRLMMTTMISECARSFERLPILMHADIIRNILYSGVWSRYEYIQIKKKKRMKK